MGKHVQTLDSAFTADLIRHTSRAIYTLGPFWRIEQYYPYPDTLCLSEPMITQGLLLGPVMALAGPIAGSNLYLYFCWWASAMVTWIYLRHRGIDGASAIFGGVVASYSPDRLWHLAGHTQLLLQAGFPLVLFGVERAFAPGAPRRRLWIFAVAITLQAFAGFYILAIFALWCAVLLLPAAWRGAGGSRTHFLDALKRQTPGLALTGILIAGVLGPVALHYSNYGKTMPHNSLELLGPASAGLRGYLAPPAEPGRCFTLLGKLCAAVDPAIIGSHGEDAQFLGYTPLFLACIAVVAGFPLLRVFKRQSGQDEAAHRQTRANMLFALAVAGVAVLAMILSAGPYLRGPDGSVTSDSTKLPFAYLYAWLPPIRFIRAPSRFAFIVQFCLALAAAYGLWRARAACLAKFGKTAAWVTTIAAFLFVALDYFPTDRIYQIWGERTDFAQYLQSLPKSDREPFVSVGPTDHGARMIQQAWHGVPTVNGYSGYSPQCADQESFWFSNRFPAPSSLVFLERVRTRRILVTKNATEDQRAEAARSPLLKKLWEGHEGTFYELAGAPPKFAEFLSTRRKEFGIETGTVAPPRAIVANFQPSRDASGFHSSVKMLPPGAAAPYPRFETTRAYGPFRLQFEKPLPPAVYTRLHLRISIANWYSMNETGLLYWATSQDPAMSEARVFRFVIPADGAFHDIEVPLGDLIAWTADDPVTAIRLDLGTRAGNIIAIEELRFEQDDVPGWLLPGPRADQ